MTEAELEPYLVMATRTMLFEEAVMRFSGMTQIPTFDNPSGVVPGDIKGLGTACQGTKIDACQKWMQDRAPKRTVNGAEITMVITQDQLAHTLCRVCKKG